MDDVLWNAPPERAANSALRTFMSWLGEREGREFPDHAAFWAWSVDELERFWAAVWDYLEISASQPYTAVLSGSRMPDVRWFPGARLNYAEHALRHGADDDTALICLGEAGPGEQMPTREISWGELRGQVAAAAGWLRRAGVQPGDRMAAYLPNIEHAVVACLAAASVGAVWALCSPDFGADGTIARLAQIEPTVLFAVDGYHWNGKTVDRRDVRARLQEELPSLRHVVHVPYAFPDETGSGTSWSEVVAVEAPLEFAQVEFSHPLWILFTSGTTGLPKGLVHSHGGITLESQKWGRLYIGLRPGVRQFIYTTTGWVLWNAQLGGLACGATAVLYEGSPGYPDWGVVWDVAARTRAEVLFLGAALVTATQNAGISPRTRYDLSALQTLLVSGSALPTEGYPWVLEHVSPEVRLDSTSGGTDICGAFVGGNDLLPVRAGEISGVLAGVALAAWDDDGKPVTDQVGELVVTKPMPSMPIQLWNDPDGVRHRESYFEPWPGVWRHGDWISISSHGSVVIHGRSDATLNRDGVRLGSSDFYDVVDAMPQVRESLVVGVEQPGGGYYLPLFVVPADGHAVDQELVEAITRELRTRRTARHVPTEIIAAPAIPHTLTGKRLEVPVKRLLQGIPLERAANLAAVDDPAVLRWYADFAQARSGGRG